MGTERRRFGILVGGGPAPGINSAIGAVTIEAINNGFEVVGIYDGFEHLARGRTDMVRPLTIADVSRIHFQGGSILRTSRADPTRGENLPRTLQALRELGIGYLITIGGDGTAYAASEVAQAANGALRVAHIPKTIDNDLPLPGGMPTFGFETARHVGTLLVLSLMEDTRTTNRWSFVTVLGRTAGHLALSIGKAAGATLTVIPEEFPSERIGLADVCAILEGAILKRLVMGRRHGLAVIAEGIGQKLEQEELTRISGAEIERDQYGRIRFSEIPLAATLRREVRRWFLARGLDIPIVDQTLGYELRGAEPIPFDIDYTRTLGYGAVRFLLSEPTDERLLKGGMVYLDDGYLRVLAFEDIRDPESGLTRVRYVDVRSENYTVAREYMIRLEPRDLEDPEMCARLAEAAHMTPDELRARFEGVVRIGLP
jgi:6-phosphofructokinase